MPVQSPIQAPQLQQNATTNIDVGQPVAPVQGINLSGAAQTASFAIRGYQQKKQDEEDELVSSVLNGALGSYDDAMNNTKDKPDVAKAQRFGEDFIRNAAGLTTKQRQTVMALYAQQVGGFSRQTAAKKWESEARTEEERKQRDIAEAKGVINELSTDLIYWHKMKMEFGDNIRDQYERNELTEDKVETMKIRARERLMDLAQTELAKQTKKDVNLDTLGESLAAFTKGNNKKLNDLSDLFTAGVDHISELAPRLPTEESTAFLERLSTEGINVGMQIKQDIKNAASAMLEIPNLPDDARKTIVAQRDKDLASVDDYFENVNMLKDQNLATIKNINEVAKQNRELNLTDQLRVARTVKEVLGGETLANVGDKYLFENPVYKNILIDIIASTLSELSPTTGFKDVKESLAVLEEGFKRGTLLEGTDPKKIEQKVQLWYKTFYTLVDKGEMKKADEATKQTALTQYMSILHYSADSDNAEDKVNATKLLNSKGFKDFYESTVKDPEMKRKIETMALDFNVDKAIDPRLGIFKRVVPEYLLYDADQGRYVVNKDLQLMSDLPRTFDDKFAPLGDSAKLRRAQNEAKELNDAMDGIVQYKEGSVLLKDKDAKYVKDFIFSLGGANIKKKGVLTDFSQDFEQNKKGLEKEMEGVTVQSVIDEYRQLTDPTVGVENAVEALRNMKRQLVAGRQMRDSKVVTATEDKIRRLGFRQETEAENKARPAIQNEDGSFSTQELITVEYDGKHYNIPTIVDGKRVSEDEAISMFESGDIGHVGKVFKSNEEAVADAKKRSAEKTKPTMKVEDVSDLNKEEFEEYIKLLREQYAKSQTKG